MTFAMQQKVMRQLEALKHLQVKPGTGLDAAFLHLYGLNRGDAAYILDTFTIVATSTQTNASATTAPSLPRL